MNDNIGDLRHYWHVIALSSELRTGSSLKRSLYGRPLLIWRDDQGQLHALDDCCAHQLAPIDVQDYRQNRVVCSYHGWQFDQCGSVTHVPSDPAASQRLKCSIPNYQVCESTGFVWILPDPEGVSRLPPVELTEFEAWPVTFKKYDFATNEELLIDNFMDPTHTGVVHAGVIRSGSELTQHEMTIRTHEAGVRVDFAERQESVGVGMQFLFGKSMRVAHCDEFLLPNLVRVTYQINGQPRFVALIACTPLGNASEGETVAFVQLRYQFGWGTRLLSPLISMLAKKVLKQDYAITRSQFENRRLFPDRSENKVACDAVAQRVIQMRGRLIAGEDHVEQKAQVIRLSF